MKYFSLFLFFGFVLSLIGAIWMQNDTSLTVKLLEQAGVLVIIRIANAWENL